MARPSLWPRWGLGTKVPLWIPRCGDASLITISVKPANDPSEATAAVPAFGQHANLDVRRMQVVQQR
jgi:hypothetical protein